MRMFKIMYIMATAYWLIFTISIIGYLSGMLSLGKLIVSGFLMIAILLEEIYYMIEEKVIKHESKNK